MRSWAARLRAGVVAAFTIILSVFANSMPALAYDGTGTGVASSMQVIVAAVTVFAFAGAIIAGRRAMHWSTVSGPQIREDLLDEDLLATRSATATEPKIVGVFEKVFLVVLILYAALDRGFAWVHVPGTPLFVGELTLGLGVLAIMSTHLSMRSLIRQSAALKVLTTWMAWGFIFLVLQVPIYGIDAIRDSALWYYGLTALLTAFLLISDPSRLGRWTDAFAKALPFLLAWFPIAIALDSVFGGGAPYVPDSNIPIFAHRFGNIAVLSAIAIGFIWLVDRERGRYTSSQRIGYTTLATIGILLAGFQNRGGLVAATIGIFMMLIFLRRRRGELMLVLAAVAIVLATFAIVTDIRIPISSGREISAAQMMDNITSVINPGSGGERQTETTQWRLNLWTTVIEDVTNERPLTGFGPGPNLGVRYGVSTNEEVPLRNPHNSHVGILARMGWIGIGLWVVLWITWVFELLQLRSRLRQRGRPIEAGLIAWLLVSTLMILLNAVFDPTLEGPQVAFWLWLLYGIGVAMSLIYTGALGKVHRGTPHGSAGEIQGDVVPAPGRSRPA